MSSIKNSGPSVLFRCDASHRLGFGHVVRCLALADELRESYGCRVSFAMREDDNVFQTVREKGYTAITPIDRDNFDYKAWLYGAVNDTEAKVFVLDVRDDLPRDVLQKLKSEKNLLLVTIDDPSDRRLDTDLAFYPPVPQVKRMDWRGFEGKLFSGWEWVILRKEFTQLNKSSVISHKSSIPRVLVTMGGSDPQAMTLKAVKALDGLEDDFNATVAVGSGFQQQEKLEEILAHARRDFNVKKNVANMAEMMAKTDLAIASFGVTAYELAAMGVPAIYLCLTKDHAESAEALTKAKAAVSLGVHAHVTHETLSIHITRLLKNERLLRPMAARAVALVDGRGCVRVADRMMTKH